MAKLIYEDGEEVEVLPVNGEQFLASELRQLLGQKYRTYGLNDGTYVSFDNYNGETRNEAAEKLSEKKGHAYRINGPALFYEIPE